MSQHGNEVLGQKLMKYIKVYRQDLLLYIDTMLANPNAFKKQIRLVDTDMNRSYIKPAKTYEQKRALHITKLINKKTYDLVLDMHTTTAEQPPSIIVASINDKNKRFLKATSIENVVVMKNDLVTTSLIGNFSQAISIEVNKDKIDDQLLSNLCVDIDYYLAKFERNNYKSVYYVQDLLLSTELTTSTEQELINFKKNSSGYYPILVGEEAYKTGTNYIGFKACKKLRIKL